MVKWPWYVEDASPWQPPAGRRERAPPRRIGDAGRHLTSRLVFGPGDDLKFSRSTREGETDTTAARASARFEVAGPSGWNHQGAGFPLPPDARKGIG